jgi:hypothetical protein
MNDNIFDVVGNMSPEEFEDYKANYVSKNYHKGPTGQTQFFISDEDNKKIFEWMDEHSKTCDRVYGYAGAIGGGFDYIFSPSSVGDFTTFKCRCGEKFNFTDYDSL